jgi:hypothetical protein
MSQGVSHVSMNFCVVDEMSMIFTDKNLVAGNPLLYGISGSRRRYSIREELARYGLDRMKFLRVSCFLNRCTQACPW